MSDPLSSSVLSSSGGGGGNNNDDQPSVMKSDDGLASSSSDLGGAGTNGVGGVEEDDDDDDLNFDNFAIDSDDDDAPANPFAGFDDDDDGDLLDVNVDALLGGGRGGGANRAGTESANTEGGAAAAATDDPLSNVLVVEEEGPVPPPVSAAAAGASPTLARLGLGRVGQMMRELSEEIPPQPPLASSAAAAPGGVVGSGAGVGAAAGAASGEGSSTFVHPLQESAVLVSPPPPPPASTAHHAASAPSASSAASSGSHYAATAASSSAAGSTTTFAARASFPKFTSTSSGGAGGGAASSSLTSNLSSGLASFARAASSAARDAAKTATEGIQRTEAYLVHHQQGGGAAAGPVAGGGLAAEGEPSPTVAVGRYASAPAPRPAAPTAHPGVGVVGAASAGAGALPSSAAEASMDNAKKTALIASALGDLLPGERVIMFLSGLRNVRCSSGRHAFVGSSYPGFDLGAGGGGGGAGGSGEEKWCCAMTFYRITVFSYRDDEDEDGATIDSGGDDNTNGVAMDESEARQTNSNGNSRSAVVQEWIQSSSVSRQFQSIHGGPTPSKHRVIQIPLASIDRVEKTTDYISSSSSTGPIMTLSKSSSFGGQMAPLLGSQGSNLSGSSSSDASSPTTTTGVGLAGGGGGGTTALMGLLLHGKDGGRTLRFACASYNDAMRGHEALNTYAFPGRRNLGYLFAFESRRNEVMSSIVPAAGGGGGGGAGGGGDGGGMPQSQAQQGQQGQQGQQQGRITSKATRRRFVASIEFERQGILVAADTAESGASSSSENGGVRVEGGSSSSPWSPLLQANAAYGLCPSYPSYLIGPRTISDRNPEGLRLIRKCAAFRSEGRLPALTWGSGIDGASIWRCSQPKVGLQGNRSFDDERYLREIADCAARHSSSSTVTKNAVPTRPPVEFLRMLSGGINESDLMLQGRNTQGGGLGASSCGLKIFDLRPKSAAMANRTGGYGYENTSYYTNTTLTFFGIGNIHAVRDAYVKISSLCLNPNANDVQWMQLVENTNWLSMVRLILSAAWQTAFHVHYNRIPILLHCSHGWDRTSQVAALAQMLLDPYYRTIEGFSVLVEKDFMSFGHPLHTRCGHGEGKGERGGGQVGGGGGDEGQIAPIFMQFIDCAFQLVNQYPEHFEFNSKFLLLLSEHIYSCRFGTLLCDTEREREVIAGIRQRTHCLWEFLDSQPGLVNPFYNKKVDEEGVLMMPLPTLLRNVALWVDRHCMYGPKATVRCMPLELDSYVRAQENSDLHKDTTLNTMDDKDVAAMKMALGEAEKWKRIALSNQRKLDDLRRESLNGVPNNAGAT